MQTRRTFLTGVAAGLVATISKSQAFAAHTHIPLGVQLYTVRQQVQADLPGILTAIRKIGYTTVETFAAQYKMSAAELRKAIIDSGLKVPSGHFGYKEFDSRFDYAKELGLHFMVCSSVPESIGNSLDGFKRAADQYNAWGEKAKRAGMQFAFHNHNSEFQTYSGTTGIEELLKRTDPKLVQWQMDCYWVAQAGRDPLAMLRKYPGRITTLHLKDRMAGAQPSVELNAEARHFTEVGAGTLNWKQILPAAEKEGARYMFVEQDRTVGPPLKSLQISYDNLRKMQLI